MSALPTAKRDVSAHPSPDAYAPPKPSPLTPSVTSPTDAAVKEHDIENKMKLYGIVEALRQGRYPSNAQIDATLEYVLRNPPAETKKLSKEGRMLVQDLHNIIRTAKSMVQRKNHDELFQNFLFETRGIDTSKANVNVDAPVSDKELKSDADQAVEHLRTLGKLIFTNSEARKLLKDISLLGRDVAADAAAKVSNLARPDQSALDQVDTPAPSNEWVGPDGQTRDHREPVPSTGLGEKREPAVNAGQQLKEEATAHAQESQSRMQGAVQEGSTGRTDGERAQTGGDAFSNQAAEESTRLRDKISNKIPEEHKKLAHEQLDKAKDYARDKFPEERRARFIYRLKKVLVENQRHRDYQEAVEFFLEKAENYTVVAKDVATQGGSQGLSIRKDSSYQRAESMLRTLLERFANGASMQPIFDAVNQLYTDSTNDPELRKWFQQLDTYARRALQEPGYIMKESSDREGRRITETGKRFFDPKEGRYAAHKDALFDAITNFFTAYADDPLNTQLGVDVKKLTKDLLMNAEGNLTYKHHLWADVREVVLPAIVKHAGYIPIPRIEFTDSSIDVVIENLTLESANMIPNVIEIDARNKFTITPYDALKDTAKHSFAVSFSQIQADLKDVAFFVHKKSGFPKLKDSGVADVFIGGKGISGVIHVQNTGRRDHAFKIVDVKVKIDKLKFAVRGSKHSMLITVLKPIATGLIKKAVAKAIEEGIRSGLMQLDAQLADISERLDAAKGDDDTSTLDVLKKTFADKKVEAQDAAPAGQFQITATRDSRLVDWSSPDSMVEKQADKQELALKHGGWKSPAFDIVAGGKVHDHSSQPTGPTSASGAAPSTGLAASIASGSTAVGSHHEQTHPKATSGLQGSTTSGDVKHAGAGLAHHEAEVTHPTLA